jgi:hypothetical protein
MARLIQKPKEEYLQHLRTQISIKFNANISTANDCENLVTAIFSKTHHRLSNDTIRRLFTLKKSTSLPSMFTLDVCAKYLEYQDWEDFVQTFLEQSALYQRALLFDVIEDRVPFESIVTRINADIKSTDLYETFNKILLYKAQRRDEEFFTRLFEFTSIFQVTELYKYDLYYTIHLVGCLCHKYEWLSTIAIENYHSSATDENYFVEWLVVPHKTYYLPLLEKYYVTNKATKSVAVFYHLIKCSSAAEQKDWKSFELHFEKLIPIIVSSYRFNSILKMRWYGVQLHHDLHFNQGNLQKNISNRILNSPQINEKDSGDRITAIFVICSYLSLLEMNELIIELYEQKALKHTSLLGHWGELNFNQLKVFYVQALLSVQRIAEAKMIFQQIKVNQFDLNFKPRMLEVYENAAKELH